jgi:hypothetical protein
MNTQENTDYHVSVYFDEIWEAKAKSVRVDPESAITLSQWGMFDVK